MVTIAYIFEWSSKVPALARKETTMDVVFLIGRLLLAAVFISSGLMAHFVGYRRGVEFARSYGAPMPELTVPATGALAIGGGLLVAFGIWADLGALMIAAFLVLITPIMHAYWKETEAQARQSQQVNFTKNLALLGGALIVFYLYNQLQGEAGLSLTDPLFG